ncbi:alpha/beta fold hydrolase [Microbacterium elymi]|uniref:Alpha/beta fold hydrolase n=1 Tax=Microbacterium elymi TaxID=2909587 RepID=A0ABY5NN01_9MICO|nr:alpha/beta fold hydrolase [Microbacterium elymi]UUT36567.1 alpha/beta fold hydrolase [Microbacterium elymi]
MTVPVLAVTEPIGPAEAPLLILGPSLGTSTIMWEQVVPALAGPHRVALWDLPGHGASPAAVDPFTVAELADAVAALAAGFGADRIDYAGVSLGGAVGLELAAGIRSWCPRRRSCARARRSPPPTAGTSAPPRCARRAPRR